MAGARHLPQHRSAQPAAWFVALVAFALACLGFWGLGVWYDRAATMGRAEARTAAVARLLEEHAARAIEAGDNLVQSLAHTAAAWDLRDRQVGRRIWEEFRGRIADSPQFDAAWIMDAEGNTVLDTLRPYPTEPSNYASRDHYRAHLGPERGLFVGAAETGARSGRPRFNLSRAVRAEDGRLRGVAVARVYSAYFAGVFAEAGLGPRSSLALLTTDGAVLAEWPIDDVPAADELVLPALRERRAAMPNGTFTAEDGIGARIIAYRTLRDRPLAVAVSVPVREALAEWRERTWRSGALALAGVGGFGLLVAAGVRAARREAAALRASEERFRAAQELALDPFTILSAVREDGSGAIVDFEWLYANPRAAAVLKRPVERLVGHRLLEVLPGNRTAGELFERYARVVETGEPHDIELFYDADGITGWFRNTAVKLGDGVAVSFRDITERKRLEEQREVLLAEFDHRIKNILALVQSMAARTGAGAPSVADFLAAFEGRLGALAAAHDLLVRGGWRGVRLGELARAALAPHFADDGERLRLEAEDVRLKPGAAQTFALIFHELATNAAKHGALAAPGGRVTLTGRVEQGADGKELRLVWREDGGPPVKRPTRAGAGTGLLSRAIGHQYGGDVEMDWRAEGLVYRVGVPLQEVAG